MRSAKRLRTQRAAVKRLKGGHKHHWKKAAARSPAESKIIKSGHIIWTCSCGARVLRRPDRKPTDSTFYSWKKRRTRS